MVFVSYFHNFLCRLLDSFLVLHSFGLNNFWTSFQRVAFSNIYGDYNLDFLDILKPYIDLLTYVAYLDVYRGSKRVNRVAVLVASGAILAIPLWTNFSL